MKFLVSASILQKHLSTINGVISNNPIVPILDNFLFQLDQNTLTVTSSDMQTTMVTELEVESRDKGSVAVPAKLLLETLRTLPDQPIQINIDAETFGTELVTSNGRYKLAGENPLDFPRIPAINRTFGIELDSSTLASAIMNTLFATSTDDLRPAMMGVYVQLTPSNTTFVATDGHRLIRYRRSDVKAETETNLILPRKALGLLKNSLPAENVQVKADFSQSNAFFSFGNIKMICRLIDERYPDYENVIPTVNPNKLTIDRAEFLGSLRRIAIYANKTTHQIRLKVSATELVISAEDLDYSNEAVEKLKCEYEGEDMEIGFNAKFLNEMLNNLTAKTVEIQMSQPNRAGLLLPQEQEAEENILMLVMPVMLNTYA